MKLTRSTWLLLSSALVLLLGAFHGAAVAGEMAEQTLRVGFSRSLFGDINLNDGTAALKIHAQTMVRSGHLKIAPALALFETADQVDEALRLRRIDVVVMSADHFFLIAPALLQEPLLVALNHDHQPGEAYVLVIRRSAVPGTLPGLKGGKIVVHEGTRNPFGLTWLDLLTRRAALGPAADYLGNIAVVSKPSQAVLPVFFGRADAAIVSRDEFSVMQELNPQIGQRLQVLATSPVIVPSVLCLSADLPVETVKGFLAAIRDIPKTVSGRQLLTIFQSDEFGEQPRSCLDSTHALLIEHDRLVARDRPVALGELDHELSRLRLVASAAPERERPGQSQILRP